MKQRKGFAIIAAIFIVLVIMLLVLAILTFVSSESIIAVKNYYSLDAFYISNAGYEYYLNLLKNDGDWSTPPTPESSVFSEGAFSIVTANEQTKRITFF